MTMPQLENKIPFRRSPKPSVARHRRPTVQRNASPLNHPMSRPAEPLPDTSVFASHPAWSAWVALLRPLHWSKNLLLFVPLFLAHEFTDVNKVVVVAWAFVAFSLSASAGYVANDLLDVASDRSHRSKCYRPLAAGQLSGRDPGEIKEVGINQLPSDVALHAGPCHVSRKQGQQEVFRHTVTTFPCDHAPGFQSGGHGFSGPVGPIAFCGFRSLLPPV